MKKTLKDFGIKIGKFERGPRNLITDVPGVLVGNYTLTEDSDRGIFRTGITAILPHPGSIYKERVFAAHFVLNGFGKSTGLVQIAETGMLETPVLITSTLNVGKVWDALVRYTIEKEENVMTLNPVVMECNDSRVNEAQKRPLGYEQVREALEGASEEFELGCVGAATGMATFGFKSGLGSSSRVVENFTVGVLAVPNFGRREDFAESNGPETTPGSIIIVVATDAPLIPNQLRRIATRAALAIPMVGGRSTQGSGDIALAFSNAVKIPRNTEGPLLNIKYIPDDSKLFQKLLDATIDAAKESIIDSLLLGCDVEGRDGKEWKAANTDEILKKLL